ncbi:MAG: hypothetical protein AB4911_06055 [Oscillochloridaceae bacterium umkhey_bin13]
MIARHKGDLSIAHRQFTEGAALARCYGLKGALAYNLHGLGEVAVQQGAYQAAQQAFDESLEICQSTGPWRDAAVVQLGLARVAAALDQRLQRNHYLHDALETVMHIDTPAGRRAVLQQLANVLQTTEYHAYGTRLRAALQAT